MNHFVFHRGYKILLNLLPGAADKITVGNLRKLLQASINLGAKGAKFIQNL